MDLSSAFKIDLDDFDPEHRHALAQARRLYSEMLLARKAVLGNVDTLDAELDSLVTRSVTIRQQLDGVTVARSPHSGALSYPINTSRFPGSQPYDLQYARPWLRSLSQYSESVAPESLAASPLSRTPEASGRTSPLDFPYRDFSRAAPRHRGLEWTTR
jgi:hypothetical protein